MLPEIKIDSDDTEVVDVSIRAVSKTHWSAFKKIAALNDKNLAECVELVVETYLDSNKG